MTVFSCYVFSPKGRVLLTRPALDAPAWPGVWAGSCWGRDETCPDPHEWARLRARMELGIALSDTDVLIPEFEYPEAGTAGLVLVAKTRDVPRPRPRAVMDWRWAEWSRLVDLVRIAPWAVAPWVADQIPEMNRQLSAAS